MLRCAAIALASLLFAVQVAKADTTVSYTNADLTYDTGGGWTISSDSSNIQTVVGGDSVGFAWTGTSAMTMELYGGFALNGGTFYIAVGSSTYSCSSYKSSVPAEDYQLGMVCSVKVPSGTSQIVVTNGIDGTFIAIEDFVFTTSGSSGSSKKTPVGAIAGGVIGGIVVIAGAIAAFLVVRRKNQHTQQVQQVQQQPQNPYATPYQTAQAPYPADPAPVSPPMSTPMMKEHDAFSQPGQAPASVPSPVLNEVSYQGGANRYSGAAETYHVTEYK